LSGRVRVDVSDVVVAEDRFCHRRVSFEDEVVDTSGLRVRTRLNPLQFSRGATLRVVVAAVVVPAVPVVPVVRVRANRFLQKRCCSSVIRWG
jgi:hypothetical protein